MLKPQQIKERRKIIQDRINLKEEEANEIVRRLKHGKPKYIELAHKPFTVEFWITWPPKNEKQKISQTEEISREAEEIMNRLRASFLKLCYITYKFSEKVYG